MQKEENNQVSNHFLCPDIDKSGCGWTDQCSEIPKSFLLDVSEQLTGEWVFDHREGNTLFFYSEINGAARQMSIELIEEVANELTAKLKVGQKVNGFFQ